MSKKIPLNKEKFNFSISSIEPVIVKFDELSPKNIAQDDFLQIDLSGVLSYKKIREIARIVLSAKQFKELGFEAVKKLKSL